MKKSFILILIGLSLDAFSIATHTTALSRFGQELIKQSKIQVDCGLAAQNKWQIMLDQQKLEQTESEMLEIMYGKRDRARLIAASGKNSGNFGAGGLELNNCTEGTIKSLNDYLDEINLAIGFRAATTTVRYLFPTIDMEEAAKRTRICHTTDELYKQSKQDPSTKPKAVWKPKFHLDEKGNEYNVIMWNKAPHNISGWDNGDILELVIKEILHEYSRAESYDIRDPQIQLITKLILYVAEVKPLNFPWMTAEELEVERLKRLEELNKKAKRYGFPKELD